MWEAIQIGKCFFFSDGRKVLYKFQVVAFEKKRFNLVKTFKEESSDEDRFTFFPFSELLHFSSYFAKDQIC
jgi:hypothetical protein